MALVRVCDSAPRWSLGRRRSYGSQDPMTSYQYYKRWVRANPTFCIFIRTHRIQALPESSIKSMLNLLNSFLTSPQKHIIINNYYSKPKHFRKSKDEDDCFLFLHTFFYYPKAKCSSIILFSASHNCFLDHKMDAYLHLLANYAYWRNTNHVNAHSIAGLLCASFRNWSWLPTAKLTGWLCFQCQ